MRPLTPSNPPTPAPWRYINGIVYGENGDGDIVAIEVAQRDGPLVEAAPDLADALRNLVTSIERAAAAGIDLTGHVGVGEALRALDKTKGRAP
jgi:hypothetical protein